MWGWRGVVGSWEEWGDSDAGSCVIQCERRANTLPKEAERLEVLMYMDLEYFLLCTDVRWRRLRRGGI